MSILYKNRIRLGRKLIVLAFVSAILISPEIVIAGGNDDPLLGKVLIDQLEVRDADEANPQLLEGQAWIGKDLNKLWFKTDVERVSGETEEFELQALYSRAVAPFWDFQVGIRQDIEPKPSETWAVIGFQGLAPYLFEVDSALFIGDNGRSALRLQAEYELMFTQQWVLSPELEANLYGQNDSESGRGSGLSDIQAGLRLRYEIRREIAPYLGVNWSKLYGQTADYARQFDSDVSEWLAVVGIRAWF